MALGIIATNNYALTGEVFAGLGLGGLPLLPAANMLTESAYVARPARMELVPVHATGFSLTMTHGRGVDLIALLFHSISPTGQIRIDYGFGDPGDPGYYAVEGEWRDAHRVTHTEDMDWLDPNAWLGELEGRAVFPFHYFLGLDEPTLMDRVIVWVRDPLGVAAGLTHFDIGGLWITRAWRPGQNFSRGRQPKLVPRDLTEEGPSGRLFSEARAPRRRLDLTWANLTDAEAGQIYDMGGMCGTRRPVLVIPDIDDPVSVAREALVATFDPPPAPTFSYSGLNTVDAGFQEIIA